MAQIDTGKKGAPSVDMTPLVDLAFLLITFFMLTSTFMKPTALDLTVPAKSKDDGSEDIKVDKNFILNIVLHKDDKVYTYDGAFTDKPELKETNFSAEGLRQVILDKKAKLDTNLIIAIKPTEYTSFKSVVDAIDEMKILKIGKFSMQDAAEGDIELLKEQELF